MSIQLTDETNVLLYNSVTGWPILTEVFSSEEQAEAFREFALERNFDLNSHNPVNVVRDEFNTLWAEYERACESEQARVADLWNKYQQATVTKSGGEYDDFASWLEQKPPLYQSDELGRVTIPDK